MVEQPRLQFYFESYPFALIRFLFGAIVQLVVSKAITIAVVAITSVNFDSMTR